MVNKEDVKIGDKIKRTAHINSKNGVTINPGDIGIIEKFDDNGYVYLKEYPGLSSDLYYFDKVDNKFKVDDRVVCVKDYPIKIKKGMTGIIILINNNSINNNSSIGVKWDNFNNGHGCDGNCSSNEGYYVKKENIEKEVENKEFKRGDKLEIIDDGKLEGRPKGIGVFELDDKACYKPYKVYIGGNYYHYGKNQVKHIHKENINQEVEKMEFEVGDRGKRMKYGSSGMEVGDIGTIQSIDGDCVYFEEYSGRHHKNNITLVEKTGGTKMENVSKENKDIAKKKFDKDNTNAEIEHVEGRLRKALDSKNTINRQEETNKKQIEEDRKQWKEDYKDVEKLL